MRNKLFILIALFLLLSACSSASQSDTVVQFAPAEEEENAEGPSPSEEDEPVEESESLDEPQAESADSGIPPRPNQAAPEDDYRADSYLHVAATGKPQLIEFFAYWCTVCRANRPKVHALEAEYWGDIDFVYLDIDNPANAETMRRYGYTSQPYFVFIDPEGNEISRWYGSREADAFRGLFDEYLATGG